MRTPAPACLGDPCPWPEWGARPLGPESSFRVQELSVQSLPGPPELGLDSGDGLSLEICLQGKGPRAPGAVT